MPQMAPLNWTLLFMMFVMMLMLFSMMNYYNFLYNIKSSKFIFKKKKINWKW